MGADPRSAAGAGWACGRHGPGQPAVCRGRALPERFGCGVKVQTRFSRWAKAGLWERVFQHLAADADNEYAMIDSTIVRAHQHAAGAPKKPAIIRPSAVARAG